MVNNGDGNGKSIVDALTNMYTGWKRMKYDDKMRVYMYTMKNANEKYC